MLHLTVIAKAPVAGTVKTRLCPPCTLHQAADVAAAALADTFAQLALIATAGVHRRLGPVRRVVLIDGEPDAWVPAGFDVVAQRGDGLADRLANGFDDLGPGVIVGMDTPAAVSGLGRALEAADAGIDSIGLARDGGYWFIGLHAVDPRVFTGIPMSATNTGLAQLRRMHQLGRPVRMLPAARDLDQIDDLRALADGPGDGCLEQTARRVLGTR